MVITKIEYDKGVQIFGELSEIFEQFIDCDVLFNNDRNNIQKAAKSVRMSCFRVRKLVLKPKKIRDFWW